MSRLALASVLAAQVSGQGPEATAATTLVATWKDCGAKHGVVTDLQPLTIETGSPVTVTGTGTVDEDVTSGHFTATVSALGTKITECSGDGTSDIVCKIPLVGSVTLKALSFPLQKGTVSIPVEINVGHIPSTLAHVDIHVAAEEQNGESAICLDVHADAQMEHPPHPPEPPQYAKGFVRQPRNAAVPVGTMTPEMRAAAPARLDWTETTGATSPVKDQGQCGSCWALSAAEAIESGVFATTGKVCPILSAEQIVDCDKGDGGCNGGDLPTAFDYVEGAGGLDTADDYPYTGGGSCKSSTPVVVVTDYKYAVPPCQSGSCSSQDEDGLKAALATHGPLAICVNAESWNSYSGGVLSGSCSGSASKLDHCVQLVGYDTTASTPYWKVRNSWGTSWGEGGFIRLPMGVNSCGVADEAMYVKAYLASSVV